MLLFLQRFDENSRNLPGMPRANPNIHGLLAHGYYIADSGTPYVRYKTSWGGSGDNTLSRWDAGQWQALLPVRGVIGYRPLPKITRFSRDGSSLQIQWQGPSSTLSNVVTRTATPLHWYVLEKADRLAPGEFKAVSEPTLARELVIHKDDAEAAFYRLKLLPPGGQDAPVE